MTGRLSDRVADNVVFKINAGKNIGNYNLRECRDQTDAIDEFFDEIWEDHAMQELETLYHQTIRTVL